jgi:hypothetical protein
MFKLSSLIAAALFAAAGAASANTIPLKTVTGVAPITTAKDTTTSYGISTVSEANGALVTFSFKYTGELGSNDFFAIFFGTSGAAKYRKCG